MKPIIILPPSAMMKEDIQRLRDNDLCVVVAKNPATVKFVDPIPAASSRTEIENAAIKLSRKMLNRGFWTNDETRASVSRAFVEILINGTPLDPDGTKEEQEQRIFESAKAEELQRLAREEAKAERAAAKKNQTEPQKAQP